VHVFGASANAGSNYFEQAQLYGRGKFEPAWFTLDEIKANLDAAYRPGER